MCIVIMRIQMLCVYSYYAYTDVMCIQLLCIYRCYVYTVIMCIQLCMKSLKIWVGHCWFMFFFNFSVWNWAFECSKKSPQKWARIDLGESKYAGPGWALNPQPDRVTLRPLGLGMAVSDEFFLHYSHPGIVIWRVAVVTVLVGVWLLNTLLWH